MQSSVCHCHHPDRQSSDRHALARVDKSTSIASHRFHACLAALARGGGEEEGGRGGGGGGRHARYIGVEGGEKVDAAVLLPVLSSCHTRSIFGSVFDEKTNISMAV